MKLIKKTYLAAALVASLGAPSAHAGIPTVDVLSMAADVIAWAGQYAGMAEQLAEAKRQYDQMVKQYEQAKNTADALKGGRGLAGLVNDPTVRQTLGPDFTKTVDNLRQLGASAASTQAKSIYGSIKAFDCTAQFPKNASLRKECEARAMVIPTIIATMNDSLARSQARVAQLQQLIGSVDTDDMKAAADLQARIAGEVAMLSNEETMVRTAQAQLQAQAELNLQAAREAGLKRMVVGAGGTNPFGK